MGEAGTRGPEAITIVCGGLGRETVARGSVYDGIQTDALESRPTWDQDPDTVRRWIDELRIRCALALPCPAHEALAGLQRALGVRACTLATTAIDGLLLKAGAERVFELRGSVFHARCDADEGHPRLSLSAFRARLPRCGCGADLRPDVVLVGEPLRHLERVEAAIARSRVAIAVGLDATLAGWVFRVAAAAKVRAIGFGEAEALAGCDEVREGDLDVEVPRLVAGWLGG